LAKQQIAGGELRSPAIPFYRQLNLTTMKTTLLLLTTLLTGAFLAASPRARRANKGRTRKG
jgi:hypothetical protein